MAVGGLKPKTAWKLHARLNDISPTIANQISKQIESYESALKYAETEEEREEIKVDDFISSEYLETFKESEQYRSIVENLRVHACGFILFDGDIREEIGLISAVSGDGKEDGSRKRTICAAIEGKHLDAFGYVKNDYLIVDAVALINKCFASIGKPVPSFDELRELIKDDKPTWDIYAKGITQCVNQVERKETTQKVMKYKPQNLAESSAFIAAIRPSFVSLLPKFLNREKYSTGESKIDEILEGSFHYMIYQESIMKVLSFLGQEMTETYGIIKSISKKKLKGEKKRKLHEEIESFWKQIFGNTDNFSSVWQIIEDSARYAFNSPHALSTAGDSAYLAYFKAHHTAKFYEVAVNHYQMKNNKDKINLLFQEASKFFNYKLKVPYFGQSEDRTIVDEEKKMIIISLNTIKGMQSIAANICRQIYNKGASSYLDFLARTEDCKVDDKKINKSSLEILEDVGFFKEFGSDVDLRASRNLFNTFFSRKNYSKKDINNPELLEIIHNHSEKETLKTFRGINGYEIIKEILNRRKNVKQKEIKLIKKQIEHLGFTDVETASVNPRIYFVKKIERDKWNRVWMTLHQLSTNKEFSYKCDVSWFDNKPCHEKDLIEVAFRGHVNRRTKVKEQIIKFYNIMK